MRRWVATAAATVVVVASGAWPAEARADEPPAVSLLVDEGVVTVRARGAAPKRDRLQAHHDHLDILLAEAPSASAKVSVDDPLLKRIELTDGQEPKLQIFVHDPSVLEALEKTGRIERRGNDLRVTLPRDPAKALAASARAEKKSSETSKGSREASVQAAPVEEAPPVVAAAVPAVPAKAEAFPVGVPDPKPIFGGNAGSSSGSGALVLLVMVVLAAGAIYVVKRRQQQQGALAESDQIRVVTQAALGPRLRLVLVRVKEREMLLSVSERGARLIDRWQSGAEEDEEVEADVAAVVAPRVEPALVARIPAPALVEEDVDLRGIEVPPPVPASERSKAPARPESMKVVQGGAGAPSTVSGPASAAVQGLLRLRLEMAGAQQQQAANAVAAASLTDGNSPDPQWAGELRSAMSARSGAA